MRELTYRTVVVGSGCAGLNAADTLASLGEKSLLLVTEDMNAGTSRNTGSDKQTYYKLSLSGDEGDSVGALARDLHYPDVNGERRQDSRTSLLIHGIPEIVSTLSRGMTLKAGTIIATGTPKGVGMGEETPRFLKKGDVVACSIEGIGTLVNTVE